MPNHLLDDQYIVKKRMDPYKKLLLLTVVNAFGCITIWFCLVFFVLPDMDFRMSSNTVGDEENRFFYAATIFLTICMLLSHKVIGTSVKADLSFFSETKGLSIKDKILITGVLILVYLILMYSLVLIVTALISRSLLHFLALFAKHDYSVPELSFVLNALIIYSTGYLLFKKELDYQKE